jgi:putative flippase GtrA
LLRQFLTFTVVGGVSTLCHFATLIVLHEAFGLSVLWSTTWGFIVGGVINYALNRRLTFADSSVGLIAVPRFLVVALTGMALNTGTMAVLAQLAPQVQYLLRQCTVSAIVLLYNFVLNRVWTFRSAAARSTP